MDEGCSWTCRRVRVIKEGNERNGDSSFEYSRSINSSFDICQSETKPFSSWLLASSHLYTGRPLGRTSCLRDSSCSLGLIVFIWPKTISFGILICFSFATRYTNEPGKNSINNQQQAAAHLTFFFFFFCFCLRRWGNGHPNMLETMAFESF